MKTCLLTLLAMPFGLVFGQIPGHFSPQTGTWANIRAVQIQTRLRHHPLPPADGFWVVEEGPNHRAIAHFYTEGQQELRAVTLRRKHLNLKKRAVVERLNNRLTVLLEALPTGSMAFQ